MTVKKLHELLGKLIEQGHARKPVRVDKPTFYSPLEDDGAVVLDVHRVDLQSVPNINDDGGVKQCSDGRESLMSTVVLGGTLARCPRCSAVDCEQDHDDNSPITQDNVDREWLRRMADAEDRCASVSVGGLAADLGWVSHKENNVSEKYTLGVDTDGHYVQVGSIRVRMPSKRDAKMFAAAPDAIEALKVAQAALYDHASSHERSDALEVVSAALRKAGVE